MATWARDDSEFPPGLRPGNPGWEKGSQRWLEDHPGRRLPFGEFGDFTDIARISVELAKALYLPADGENLADPRIMAS